MDAIACEAIEVMIVGTDVQADALFESLTQHGHVVYMRALSSAGAYTSTSPHVAFLIDLPQVGYWEAVDRLHALWPQTPIVVVSDHISIELEDEAALREFVSLRLKTHNFEEFHALAHNLLRPRPDTRPLALEAPGSF